MSEQTDIPSTPTVHQRKARKNYAVLAMIIFWIALIWIITMIKLGFGS